MIFKQISILAAIIVTASSFGLIEADLSDLPEAETIIGEWKIVEFIDTVIVEIFEADYDDQFDGEKEASDLYHHNTRYLDEIITLNAKTIKSYSPHDKDGGYFDSLSEINYGCRIPDTVDLEPPFLHISLEHKDFEKYIELIMDSRGFAYIDIDGYIYSIEKVEAETTNFGNKQYIENITDVDTEKAYLDMCETIKSMDFTAKLTPLALTPEVDALHAGVIRDRYIVLNDDNEWETVLALEQGIYQSEDENGPQPYYSISVDRYVYFVVDEETWDELAGPFFDVMETAVPSRSSSEAGNNFLPPVKFEKVFGELLEID